MTRPVVVGPGVVVAADVCAFLGPVLGKRLAEAQRNREPVTGDVVETIEAIVRAGEIFRGRAVPTVPTPVPKVADAGTDNGHWISVRQVTEILKASGASITERAVTKRCVSGALTAVKGKGGAWMIDPRSLRKDTSS